MALLRHVRQLVLSGTPRAAALPTAQWAGLPALAAGLGQARWLTTSKLFIGGLSWETSNDTLRDAFSSFGEVKEARIIVDRETGRSRGFGFVGFTSPEAAQNALEGMNGKVLGGRTIRVDYAVRKERPPPTEEGVHQQQQVASLAGGPSHGGPGSQAQATTSTGYGGSAEAGWGDDKAKPSYATGNASMP